VEMTKVPPLLSAPDIKGIRGNVIIDFTISAALSHDVPTLRLPSKYQPNSPYGCRREKEKERARRGMKVVGLGKKSASLPV